MPRLSVFDLLHRGVVYSLLGISGWAVFVGVYGHKERKAALMARAQAVRHSRMAASEQQKQEEFALARAAQDVIPSKKSS
ncbi:hypothetical protein DFH08DRAFT_958371 [Mycena albidolilacea]|uniref:Uncharacterized protein n=1 Tax=Mycena albidolilacea TaxID=1033008 RepID=A0AAD7A6R9_9AGAR|nr:hypothetical protein DFH08DRAFT_958371 [Mycena albidolilacea]